MKKDWKQTYLGKTLVRYENKKTGKLVFAIPTRRDKINGKWSLHLPNKRYTDYINYRGKMEVKRAMRAYMRTH